MPRMKPPRIACEGCALGQACAGSCAFVHATYPAGQTLFQQGDAPHAAHFVKRGLVLLTETDAEGQVVRQTLRPAGSLLDAQVLSGLAHRAAATALTSVEICALALPALRVWMGPRRSPASAFLELALGEGRAAEREAAGTRRSATAKVAGFLLACSAEGGDRALELPHRLIAGLLGMRAETLSRALARLRAAGGVVPGAGLWIRDRTVLEELAGEPAS
jgi:CRP-like cAMP-binding protein